MLFRQPLFFGCSQAAHSSGKALAQILSTIDKIFVLLYNSYSCRVNENSNAFGKNVRRVPFYEDYSYEKFVGAYMLVQDIKTTNLSFDDKVGFAKGEDIAYKFNPDIMQS